MVNCGDFVVDVDRNTSATSTAYSVAFRAPWIRLVRSLWQTSPKGQVLDTGDEGIRDVQDSCVITRGGSWPALSTAHVSQTKPGNTAGLHVCTDYLLQMQPAHTAAASRLASATAIFACCYRQRYPIYYCTATRTACAHAELNFKNSSSCCLGTEQSITLAYMHSHWWWHYVHVARGFSVYIPPDL